MAGREQAEAATAAVLREPATQDSAESGRSRRKRKIDPKDLVRGPRVDGGTSTLTLAGRPAERTPAWRAQDRRRKAVGRREQPWVGNHPGSGTGRQPACRGRSRLRRDSRTVGRRRRGREASRERARAWAHARACERELAEGRVAAVRCELESEDEWRLGDKHGPRVSVFCSLTIGEVNRPHKVSPNALLTLRAVFARLVSILDSRVSRRSLKRVRKSLRGQAARTRR